MKWTCLSSLAIVAMVATGCNRSNSTAQSDTAGTAGRSAEAVSMGDRDFVQDVTRMNAAEIELSRLAVERSPSADVKKFAQMLVDDHTAAGAKLGGIATQNAIEAPAEPNDSQRKTREQLAGKQGLDFDKDFADTMIDEHQKLVDKLESRVDKTTLSKWKGEVDNPVANDRAQMDVKAQTVTPEKSDDVVTQRINAWAAETYPVAYAHLQAARTLKDAVRKRATD